MAAIRTTGRCRWITSSGPPSRRSERSSSTAASRRRRRRGGTASSSARRPRGCACSASTARTVRHVILTHFHYRSHRQCRRLPERHLCRAGPRDGLLDRALRREARPSAGSSSRRMSWGWCGTTSPGGSASWTARREIVPGVTVHHVGGHAAGSAGRHRAHGARSGRRSPPTRRTTTPTSRRIAPSASSRPAADVRRLRDRPRPRRLARPHHPRPRPAGDGALPRGAGAGGDCCTVSLTGPMTA